MKEANKITMNQLSMEITIPVYNEERRLEKGVRRLYEYCLAQEVEISIAIADNGSTDRTVSIAHKLCTEIPRVRLVSLSQKGVGRALKQSWSSSNADVIGYMDVDLSTDLGHLTTVWDCFERDECDVLTASRLLKGARVQNRKLKREVASRVYNFILRSVLGISFSDGMCGFKFLRRSVYLDLLSRGLKNDEWFFNTELLVIAEWAGLRVEDTPVNWSDDPDSKADILELAFKYLREITRLWKLRPKRAQREVVS